MNSCGESKRSLSPRDGAAGLDQPVDQPASARLAVPNRSTLAPALSPSIGSPLRQASMTSRSRSVPISPPRQASMASRRPSVSTTLLCSRFENGDFSLHYHEEHETGAFDHRWDRHPSGHNARDHVHPGPDAPTPGDDTSHPANWRDVLSMVFSEMASTVNCGKGEASGSFGSSSIFRD